MAAMSEPFPSPSQPEQPKKKRWADLTDGQRKAIVLGGLAELVVTTVALRDLARRPAAQVRGAKPVWALACFVQPVGPVVYLLAGRRRGSR
jgi:hypothetical protein